MVEINKLFELKFWRLKLKLALSFCNSFNLCDWCITQSLILKGVMVIARSWYSLPTPVSKIAVTSLAGSPSAGKEDGQGHSTTAVDEPVGSLKFHDKPTTQMMAPLYGRLELNCVVSGAPPPVVYWLKNGQPIRESPYETEELTNRILESSPMPSRGLASTKSRLILECINEDDEAIYSCVAESHSGEKVVSSTYVHIEGIEQQSFTFKFITLQTLTIT